MYRFNKMKDERGGWRLELDGISILVDNFIMKDGKHWIKNPTNAIAFFQINESIYGVLNDIKTFLTVEDFYDCMLQQYLIFKHGFNKEALKQNTIPVKKADDANSMKHSA